MVIVNIVRMLDYFSIMIMFCYFKYCENVFVTITFLFLLYHLFDKPRRFKGALSAKVTIALKYIDIPEGLPVPLNLEPANSILLWNIYEITYLDPVFEFVEKYL
jgi:uncharacterized protein (DUF58 family)